ncbi:MAG: SGNH/GDSL hydrolase family protein [Inhella sp.]
MNWVQLRSGLAAVALAALAACGGGKGQIEPFVPTRLVSFGDEHSLLTADGKRYGVNGLKAGTTTGEIDCTANPIWVQALTSHFGLVLAQCNPENKPVTAFLRGSVGAKVADVKAQIDQQLASGSVGPKDLLVINAGFYDVLEAYQQFPTRSEGELTGLVQQRGRELAAQVNRLANANGRVVVLTVFDAGLTPAGQNEKATKTDTDRAALLTRLTNAFNVAMRLALIEDGRLIGLVLADEAITTAVRFPSAFGYTDVKQAACTVDLPNCTTATVRSEVGTNVWLWADGLHLGAAGQTLLGNAALTRAANNPF